MHAGTNDIKRVNILKTTNKIERKVKIPDPVEDSSSDIPQRNIAKRQNKNISKKVSNVNDWNNYCYQTKLNFIDKQSIIDHFRARKFNMKNKRETTIFASNLLLYMLPVKL